MDETNKNNQFPASPQSGWIKTGSPSSDNKQTSSSAALPKVVWILVGGGIILLLALFTGLLIAKKFTKKPSIYTQYECQPGQAISYYCGPCDNNEPGMKKCTKFCRDHTWEEEPSIVKCDPYPHLPNNNGGGNGGGNNGGGNNGGGNGGSNSTDLCCSGTPECIAKKGKSNKGVWRCVRKEGTNCTSGSVCKFFENQHDPSACSGDEECAAWEVCQDGHCRSKAGCSRDSDCVKGAKCVNGTCQGIDKGIECYADSQGVKIINKTGGKISGNVDWFASWCNNPKACGYCGGEPNHEYVTLEAGQVWTRGFTNSENKEKGICDWQTDLKATLGSYTCQTADTGCDHNCHVPPTSTPTPTPTPTLTPTPTPSPLTSCTQVKILKVNGQPYSSKTTLKPGDVLLLQGNGDTTINKTIDQLYFTIFKKGGTAIVDAGEGTNLEYTISQNVKHYTALYQFTVPDYGVYSVSLAVHSPEDGWSCTN